MEKIKRYFIIAGVEHESDNGRWVEYEDVAKLFVIPRAMQPMSIDEALEWVDNHCIDFGIVDRLRNRDIISTVSVALVTLADAVRSLRCHEPCDGCDSTPVDCVGVADCERLKA